MAMRAMAATSQPLATSVAIDILRSGGTAVDAALAANAALGLMEPTGCGIGGDLLAIVWDPDTRRLHGLNASGRCARGLTRAHFIERGLTEIPSAGALSVSVPGAVAGWFDLHGRFGRLPLAAVLEPSIDYARSGFPVSEIIAREWAAEARRLEAEPGFARVFMPGGRAPRAGEPFRNPALADAYTMLIRDGRDGFYRGPVAAAIEAAIARGGGFLRREDLADHCSEWVEPVSTTYRGYEVFELPPNAQGIAALQMLNVLEGYDLSALEWGGARHLHYLVEAKKLAFEDRALHYADPEFARVPVAALLSKAYAAERRRLISETSALEAPSFGDPLALECGDTVYLATADADGMMVSLIQSNFRGMGSGVIVEDFGFGLQNRGHQFALDPEHPNTYAPGKRPFHTIMPGFLTRGAKQRMAFGVMGAAMQPQGHVQVLTNMIDFGLDLQQAGDAPRVRHDGSSEPTGEEMSGGGVVYLEPGFPDRTLEELRSVGHRIDLAEAPYSVFGGYQAICCDARLGVYRGASDRRKDGQAAGY